MLSPDSFLPKARKLSHIVMRVGADDLTKEPMETMNGRCVAPEHKRALSWHNLDSALLAKLDRLAADRTVSSCPVHPNFAYSRLGAILHHNIGNFWGRDQECCLDWRLDILYSSKAALPEKLWDVRIDENDVISAPAELFKQLHTKILRVARNSYHGNAFVRKEVLDCL
jgi:hypothetical protein